MNDQPRDRRAAQRNPLAWLPYATIALLSFLVTAQFRQMRKLGSAAPLSDPPADTLALREGAFAWASPTPDARYVTRTEEMPGEDRWRLLDGVARIVSPTPSPTPAPSATPLGPLTPSPTPSLAKPALQVVFGDGENDRRVYYIDPGKALMLAFAPGARVEEMQPWASEDMKTTGALLRVRMKEGGK